MHEATRDYLVAIVVCALLFFALTAIRFIFAAREGKRYRQLNEVLRDLAERALQPVRVNIGHGDQLDRPLVRSAQRLVRRARATAATTAERQLDFIGAGRVRETLG